MVAVTMASHMYVTYVTIYVILVNHGRGVPAKTACCLDIWLTSVSKER